MGNVLSFLVCLALISMSNPPSTTRKERPFCQMISTPRFQCNASDSPQVEVTVLPRRLLDGWELETTMSNRGKSSVMIMQDPTRVDGSKGPYVALNKMDRAALDVSVQVYPLPIYSIYVNRTRVSLQRLGPSENHTEKLTITFPLEETMPPYGDNPNRNQISRDGIKFVNVWIGVVPDEEGIRDLLQRKTIGPFVDGLEELMVGQYRSKRLIELQALVCSGSIPLHQRHPPEVHPQRTG